MNKVINLIKNKKFQLAVLIALLFVLIVITVLVRPVGHGEDKLVKIEKGWGSGGVAQELKGNGLIESKWLFVFYVWVRGYNSHLQAGEYLLSPKMGFFEIAKIIAKGEISENVAKVTIPEGWSIKQINERLVSAGVIPAEEKISQNEEGYLFPDTYYFYKNSSVDDIVQKMKSNFDSKMTEEMKKEIKKQNKNLYDILIMASIVEKEVKSDEDRAIVSGIFWKRIENKMPLQADITIAYILGVDKWRYSYEDTKINSPYNTYVNLGLPPTPIDNPGFSAIHAALYPKYTDYIYFLSTPDGTTVYARTLEEHIANKAKYLK